MLATEHIGCAVLAGRRVNTCLLLLLPLSLHGFLHIAKRVLHIFEAQQASISITDLSRLIEQALEI